MDITRNMCSYCGIRPAKRLCDAPIGSSHFIGHPPHSEIMKAKDSYVAFHTVYMSKTITCDRPICEKCATRIAADIDFCPSCMERIKKTITHY